MLSVDSIRRGAAPSTDSWASLARWGFDGYFADQIGQGDDPAWVVLRVATWDGVAGEVIADGVRLAEQSGKFKQATAAQPATGDWALARLEGQRLIIQRILQRRTALVRRASGRGSQSQVVVANVDVLFVVTSANRDLSERRLERYLAAALDSGAQPVIVLNKVDLVQDLQPWRDRIAKVASGVDVVQVSAHTGDGLALLDAYANPGKTLALVGSSGVGKSSLINRWLGVPVQDTGGLDQLERGRHTTTRRSILQLPNGAVLVDTPGMREFGLVDVGAGLDAAFDDVVSLAAGCRFHDCSHVGEPGCAVAEAIEHGQLEPERLESYNRLQREATVAQARGDQRLAQAIKRQNKARSRAIRSHYNAGNKRR